MLFKITSCSNNNNNNNNNNTIWESNILRTVLSKISLYLLTYYSYFLMCKEARGHSVKQKTWTGICSLSLVC